MKYLQEDLSINKKEKVLQRAMTSKETVIVQRIRTEAPVIIYLLREEQILTEQTYSTKFTTFLVGERTGGRRNPYHLKSLVNDAVKGNLSERIPRRNESTLNLDEKSMEMANFPSMMGGLDEEQLNQ